MQTAARFYLLKKPMSAKDTSSNVEQDSPNASIVEFPVVGIGGAAGGLQALELLLASLPFDTGMAFVVVLHPLCDKEGHAQSILQRSTKMAVKSVLGPTPLRANNVYLVPPTHCLSMAAGIINVRLAEHIREIDSVIDLCFRTLAEACSVRAIGILLSGTESDGALGLGRIKERAGFTFVQHPDEAEYDQMPRNAISTGMVDFVLPLEKIAEKLVDLCNNARTNSVLGPHTTQLTQATSSSAIAMADAEIALGEILRILHEHTGHDFKHYKRSTVRRRVDRRLQVNGLHDLSSYAALLNTHPAETTALLADMLIGVTNYFRDVDAFEAMQREVVPKLFADKADDEPIRGWVAACSTGEEAYSLAMLLLDADAKQTSPRVIQLFATDIDEKAIRVARAGTYRDSIKADVSPERLDRFFLESNGRYVVKGALREKVLFAAHNLLSDPPFSHLDIVTCRNLLIYLDRVVQRQVLETFHFALEPGGILFLGNAESAEAAGDLFIAVDKKNRIYRSRRLVSQSRRRNITAPIPVHASHTERARAASKPNVRGAVSPLSLHERLRAKAAAPSILVDREADIIHASNDAVLFLRQVGGVPTRSLLSLIHPDLRVEIRAALFSVFRNGGTIDIERARASVGEGHICVNVQVRCFQDDDGLDVALLSFTTLDENVLPKKHGDQSETDALDAMDSELQRMKSLLQESNEQSGVNEEELKAANEELQSTVEELRSSGEELETSKEELQAVNEELLATNGELQFKVAEADREHDDLNNFISASGIATIFIDPAMRIKRYSAAAVALFRLIPSDLGRPLLDLVPRVHYPELANDVRLTFDALRLIEREVTTAGGEWYLARLQPYRTQDNHIDGVILTFVDITSRKTAQIAALASADRLKLAALATQDYAIIVQDLLGTIVSWNGGAVRVFGYEEADAIGQPIDLIFTERDRHAGAPLAERENARVNGRAEDERWHLRKDGIEIYCSGVMTPIETDNFSGFAKIARDLTDRKSIENQQQLQLAFERTVREQAEEAVRLKDEFFAVLSHELKNPLNLIHVKAELLHRSPKTRGMAIVQDAADAIQRSVVAQSKIIDDLLDLSRVRTGKLSLQLGPLDLAATARAIVEAISDDADKVGVELIADVGDEVVEIYADAVRVEQMIWNLVRNALKFTPPGGRVSIALSSDADMACIEVRDTGQGIEPEFLSKIFDMFSQADGGGRRDAGGLGIGLSIVKQVAEMHGGRIVIQSEGPGKGTDCRLCLPKGLPLAVSDTRTISQVAPALTGLEVLLVDDAVDALQALDALFEMEGATVHMAQSAEQALEMANENKLDIVVSDIGMPTMSGYELVARLRASPRTADLPIIALTGFGRKEDAAKALRAGFNAHIAKPAIFKDLLEVVLAYVG